MEESRHREERGGPASPRLLRKGVPAMLANLSLKIFYPDAVSERELDAYNEAYSFWYAIWRETRREVDDGLAIPSDSFSRQSEILVLYVGERPIATCCHRYVDLRHRCVIQDSFFSAPLWPEHVRSAVPRLGRTCMLGSHIFIDPDFRKTRSGLPTKNLVCALSLAHIDGTKPDVVLGMTRIDRGMDRPFHDSGAISLHAHARWYHIPVDLIALFPRTVPITIDPGHREIVRAIGATCDRFARDYFQRSHLSGGLRATRTPEAFERLG
jgi:hypothetical protein